MKVSIKTLKASSFEIEVDPSSKVADVKKLIEATQGQNNVYPADQQMLIHQGNFLRNETTLEENKVHENSFVIMLSNKGSSSAASATAKAPASQTSVDRVIPASPAIQPPPAVPEPVAPISAPAPIATAAPAPTSAAFTEADPYGQAASNHVAGGNLEENIQSILEIGGGAWDRGTVVRALQSAQPAIPSSGPNANPLDLFPQALPNASSNAAGGNHNVLQNNTQFRGLVSLVQANPQILQPLLQQLRQQNPQIMQLIQENQTEFRRLINVQPLGAERSLLDHFARSLQELTTEENEAIQRLVEMGFHRNLVLEVFYVCYKDEQMAANYLLYEMDDYGSGW